MLLRNLLLSLGVVGIAACSAAESDGDVGDDLKESSSAISASCNHSRSAILASVSGGRKTAIQRGFTWLDAKVPYSQSAYHGGYRTDCSGFVSMCWTLGTSYTTADFSTGGGQSEKLAGYDDLVPGDALVRRQNGEGHVVLFLGWNDAAHSGACVLEQASTASDMQFRVRTTASLKGSAFKAIRADKFAASTAPVSGDDDEETAVECETDGTCNPGGNGAGKICVSGQCVAGCRTDAQCPGNTSCVDGQCE
jgi:hypothetical protein